MSLLWLSDSAKELLAVELVDASNANDVEWLGMALLNQGGTDWLNGELDTGTYMDMLESFGIDPSIHIANAAACLYE